MSFEASQPKPFLSDQVAQEANQSDLAQGLESESLRRDIPQDESNNSEGSGKGEKTPDQKHSLRNAQEAIFTKASDVLPAPKAGEMYDFQPHTQKTVNRRLGESVSRSEVCLHVNEVNGLSLSY